MKIKRLCLAAVMMLGVACSNNTTPPPNNGCDQAPSMGISCGGKNFCANGCITDYSVMCGSNVPQITGSCSCSGQVSGDEVNGKYCAV